MSENVAESSTHPTSGTAALTLGALGIVFGDIGTSPLYAFRESFESEAHPLDVVEANVLGVLSLVFWSLIIVVTIKYLVFVMRADNRGEGGILALTSLVSPRHGQAVGGRRVLVLIGLFGTAVLYGDGMITPAISVLSAVEGTEVASPGLTDYVVPISVVILVALFAVQSRGTGAVGRVFGPVVVVWFAVLGVLGAVHIADSPDVLVALNPSHAVRFFTDNGLNGFLVLGSVFLVVTGGEALYADMGHFGKRPITLAWYSVVLPGLMLNYLGQGAMLLDEPETISNPLFHMVPTWGVYPLVVLACAATVIASQALISGAFSLTAQAVQLGYVPRVRIRHTSETERGQIYVPTVNWVLMVSCVGLVIGFRNSTNLAAAYGIAVTLTMVTTTLLFYVVARDRFRWPRVQVLGLCGLFLVVDLAFFGANLPKVPHGGWFSLAVGLIVFTLLTTWYAGRRLLASRIRKGERPLRDFVEEVVARTRRRVPGTAIYLFSNPGGTPPALVANWELNHVVHERIVVVSVITDDVPRVEADDRLRIDDLGAGVQLVEVHYGFVEEPDIPSALAAVRGLDPGAVTYFLGKETILPTRRPGMALWREKLFALMSRNATAASQYFNLPTDRVFEVGRQVEI